MTTLLSTSAPSVVFPASADVAAIIRLALAEDRGRGDLTTEATVPPGATATAEILQKAPGVLCGLPVVEAVFATIDPRVVVERLVEQFSQVDAGRERALGPRGGGPGDPGRLARKGDEVAHREERKDNSAALVAAGFSCCTQCPAPSTR